MYKNGINFRFKISATIRLSIENLIISDILYLHDDSKLTKKFKQKDFLKEYETIFQCYSQNLFWPADGAFSRRYTKEPEEGAARKVERVNKHSRVAV